MTQASWGGTASSQLGRIWARPEAANPGPGLTQWLFPGRDSAPLLPGERGHPALPGSCSEPSPAQGPGWSPQRLPSVLVAAG